MVCPPAKRLGEALPRTMSNAPALPRLSRRGFPPVAEAWCIVALLS